MRKHVLFILFFLAGFLQKIKAQKQNPQNYRSQLYVQGMAPVSKILFLYRPELFTKKGFNQLADELEKRCEEKNVHIEFSVMRSSRAEELALKADLICRINLTELLDNYLYKVKPGDFRKSVIPGSGGKGYSIMAFVSTDPEAPVWKCNCDLATGMGNNSEKEAAKCIFTRLVDDGLIK